MANVLKQKITLEGAEEINKKIEDLGNNVEKFLAKAKASFDGSELLSFREKLAAVGVVAGVVVTAVNKLGTALVAMADDAAKAAATLGRAADAAGQTVENFQKTKFALQQAGLTADEAGQAMQKSSAGAAKAVNDLRAAAAKLGVFFAPTAEGSKAAAQSMGLFTDKTNEANAAVLEFMKRSGAAIDVTTGAMQQTPEVWARFADSIAKIQDPLKRVEVLTRLFGETLGRRLAAEVKNGGEAMRAAALDAERLGIVQTDAQRKVADAFEKAQQRLTAVRASASQRTGLALAELLTPLINGYTNLIAEMNAALDRLLAAGAGVIMRNIAEIQTSGVWSWLTRLFNEEIARLKADIAREWAIVKTLFNIQPDDTLWSWITRQFNAEMARLKSDVTTTIEGIKQALQTAFSGFMAFSNALDASVWAAFEAAGVAAWNAIGSAIEGVMGPINAVIEAIGNAIARLQQLLTMSPEPGTPGGGLTDTGGAPFASGGYTGAGSRMTPAGIVHRGEYVQPARVVGRPGVLPFMEMLRRTGDLEATIRRFTRGFDMGGLVDGLNRSLSVGMLPGFAAGGLVPASGGRRFTVDLRTNAGTFAMTTDEDTAIALTRVARRSGNNTTMRRAPMWDR